MLSYRKSTGLSSLPHAELYLLDIASSRQLIEVTLFDFKIIKLTYLFYQGGGDGCGGDGNDVVKLDDDTFLVFAANLHEGTFHTYK